MPANIHRPQDVFIAPAQAAEIRIYCQTRNVNPIFSSFRIKPDIFTLKLNSFLPKIQCCGVDSNYEQRVILYSTATGSRLTVSRHRDMLQLNVYCACTRPRLRCAVHTLSTSSYCCCISKTPFQSLAVANARVLWA